MHYDLVIRTQDKKRIEKYLNAAKQESDVVFDDVKYRIINTEIREMSDGSIGIFCLKEIIIYRIKTKQSLGLVK